MTEVPTRARVVIIGGGVIGTSVAYHLTKLGWADVVLIEQGHLSSGTTWHAAGLVGQLRASQSGTRLVQYSTELYAALEEEVGLSTGYKRCGGLIVARTEDRMVQLRRTAATAEAYGLDCTLLSPSEAADCYPVMHTDDLVGAVWLPGDGKANPTDLTAALAKGARLGGASVIEGVRALEVGVTNGAVSTVRTEHGDIETDVVVNCAGQWAKQLADPLGVTVPLHSAEHFYVVTDQMDGIHPDLPILRDPDGYTYFKEEVGGLVVGAFEPDAKPWRSPDDLPYPFEFQLLDEDWDHFAPMLSNAIERIPALADVGIRKFYNGPESFTPDNQFILGEAPTLRNYFVGAGFNSVGIASAGGAGRALAEWIIEGHATTDLLAVDIRRFASFHGNNAWLRERVPEVLGLHYALPWPNRELESARPQRRSPIHGVLADQNACFGSRMGWERPNFFAPAGESPGITYAWERQNWHPWVVDEQRATRESVAVFDQTSFSKYIVVGRDAESTLQWLCTNDVSMPIGRSVYTGLLNARGTYESDLTVTRTGPQTFLLVSSSATTERDQDWIRRNVSTGDDVHVVDVTSAYAVFGVMGPRSRDLLTRLTSADLRDTAFGFSDSRELTIGTARVRATRITYVGELGWELYVPTEFAVGVYEDLMAAGADLGVANAGYYAIEAMRLEKGYRAYGRDLTPEYGPVEAGLSFACKVGTDIDFLGRAEVEKAKVAGPQRRLVSFVVDDPRPMLWGGELVLRDDVAVGFVTSAAYGATVGACVGLAYVTAPDGAVANAEWVRAGAYAVDVAGARWSATVSLRPPYDPKNERIRR